MAFFKRRRFGVRASKKSAVPDGLWMKCPACRQAVYRSDKEGNAEWLAATPLARMIRFRCEIV